MRFVLALLMSMVTAMALADEMPSAQDRDAIQTVITQQLDAFNRDDADAAFGLAAPMIQQMFGSSGNFIGMVERGYPPVFRSKRPQFGTLETTDDDIIQHVFLTGPDGVRYLALYHMEKQADGSWKISGCQLTESTPLAT